MTQRIGSGIQAVNLSLIGVRAEASEYNRRVYKGARAFFQRAAPPTGSITFMDLMFSLWFPVAVAVFCGCGWWEGCGRIGADVRVLGSDLANVCRGGVGTDAGMANRWWVDVDLRLLRIDKVADFILHFYVWFGIFLDLSYLAFINLFIEKMMNMNNHFWKTF